MTIGLEQHIVDRKNYDQAVQCLAVANVHLPRIGELADPLNMEAPRQAALANTGRDDPDPRNLYRIHWHNDHGTSAFTPTPSYLEIPPALSGVAATIVVALGNRFPLVHCHKLLAAYGCLVPRLITGQFNPHEHRAVWPSTGNYCRGGVALSRILGCRSVAVLPEGMSRERFAWLERWVSAPQDIHRTPGTESNVKEIYDACHELAQDPQNIVLNQFQEFGNYVVHRAVTGPALARIFTALNTGGDKRLRAFVSATGSAGTLAAGDHLKHRYGSANCAVEALECPTLLYNGYGEHNIQGIGDKHVPLIHNILATDFVIGVSDRASDALNLLFNASTGQEYLHHHQGMDWQEIGALSGLGMSSIANVLASIKLAKYLRLGPSDVILTVATDGAKMYTTEKAKAEARDFAGAFTDIRAAEVFGRYLSGAATDHVLEANTRDRERMFNLGYYTWVEQQGIPLADFDRRREQGFWDDLMTLAPAWDRAIDDFNAQTGVTAPSAVAQ